MEEGIFFSALYASILSSVAQGFFIYVVVKILLRATPNMSAEIRFRILYSAMLMIFAGFIITLYRSYSTELQSLQSISANSAISIPRFEQPQNYFVSNGADLHRWISAIYFMGIFVQSILILAGLHQLKTLRMKSNLWKDKFWEERLQYLCLDLAIHIPVKLHLAERIFSPFTAGFLKPVIIFPIAMLNRLSHEQVEAILIHELGHIKRNDYILNILHKIIETTLYFNPFVWLLSGEIRKQREFACDDLVVKYTKDTNQYAHALVQIAESNLKNCSFGIAAASDNKFHLFNRIKRLKQMKTQQHNPNSVILLLLSITVALVSLACIIPTDTNIPPSAGKPLVQKFRQGASFVTSNTKKPVLKPLNKEKPLKQNLKRLPALGADTDSTRASAYFKSEEWKKQMEDVKSHIAEIKKQFESPEWKKQIQDMKLNSEEAKKHFDSPEWKKHIKDMKIHSEEMKKHFDSPEWKKEMENMKTQALAMQKEFDSPEWKQKIADLKTNALEMKKQFDSPEWKKQIEDIKLNAEEIRKKFDSPEWKKQIQEIKQKSMEMKLDADKASKKPNP